MLPALVLLLAATSCGDDEEANGLGEQPVATSVIVVATVADLTTTHQLSCDPVAGDHPGGQAACDALLKADLTPPPADQVCTEIYGGPETASIKGTVKGVAVDRAFDRANGCGISAWESLGVVLPEPVGVQPPE